MHGPVAVSRYVQDWIDTFDDFSVVAEEPRDVGDDRVLTIQRLTGRAKLSGTATDLRYAVVNAVRDGKVVQVREYRSLDQALEAVGRREQAGRRADDHRHLPQRPRPPAAIYATGGPIPAFSAWIPPFSGPKDPGPPFKAPSRPFPEIFGVFFTATHPGRPLGGALEWRTLPLRGVPPVLSGFRYRWRRARR
jgi:hypothetical protein